jgi:phenylalanyl-tRNA synthetase beta chain
LQHFRRKVRAQLEAAGLSEVIGYSLTTKEKALEFIADKTFPTTSLMLPMTEEHETLRVNVIPGLLETIAYNQNRKVPDVAIYEMGNIFLPSDTEDGRPTELPNLAFAISGNVTDATYAQDALLADFYSAKGIVGNLLAGIENVTYTATDQIPALHPGRTAAIQAVNRHIGFVGQVHPVLAKKYGIAETFVAGLDLQAMLDLQPAQTVFTEIPRYPEVSRDIALLVDKSAKHSEILSTIKAAGVKTLVKVELFDLYQGENLPQGKKSMAYSLTFLNREATMTDEEINHSVNKIVKKLVEKLQVEMR